MVDHVSGPLFKCFGSKWNSSKHYPVPLHRVIVEPFAGSACYALRHAHTIDHAVLWDTDPEIAQLWRWLIGSATHEEIMSIPIVDVPYTDILSLGLNWGQALLVKRWQRTNSQTRTWTTSPWGHLPGQWTANTRARVADQVKFIKSWEFREPRWNERATWFIDPPYQFNYKYGQAKIDYTDLRDKVVGLKESQVIVCEAVHPKTGEYPSWLPFSEFRRTVTSRRKIEQSHHSRELIYVA